MEWTLPGTVLSVDADRPQAAEEAFFLPCFLAGGLVLSQVTQVTGLEPYIIQNWVRRGFFGTAEAAQVHAPPVEPHLDDQRVEKHAFHRADL